MRRTLLDAASHPLTDGRLLVWADTPLDVSDMLPALLPCSALLAASNSSEWAGVVALAARECGHVGAIEKVALGQAPPSCDCALAVVGDSSTLQDACALVSRVTRFYASIPARCYRRLCGEWELLATCGQRSLVVRRGGA